MINRLREAVAKANGNGSNGNGSHPRLKSNLRTVKKGGNSYAVERLLDTIGEIRCVGKRWFQCRGEIWQELECSDIFAPLVYEDLGTVATARTIKEVIELLRLQKQIKLDAFRGVVCWSNRGRAILISLANGLLRVDLNDQSIRLLPHKASRMILGNLPVEWDEKAECPRFLEAVEKALPDKADRELYRLSLAHVFYPEIKFPISLYCYGESGGGKSTLTLDVMVPLLGSYLTSLSMTDLCKSCDAWRFLEWGLLNLTTEGSHKLIEHAELFNQWVSGEPHMVNPKWQVSRSIRSRSKFWILTNHFPNFEKGSDAQVRRISMLCFSEYLVGETKHGELAAAFIEEKAGILGWIVRTLYELDRLRELPSGGEYSINFRSRFAKKNNPMGSFIKECCEFCNRDVKTSRGEIMKAFENYLLENDFRVEHKKRLYDYIRNHFGQVEWRSGRSDRKVTNCLFGIRLNETGKKLLECNRESNTSCYV
jgi:hypothetical protein